MTNESSYRSSKRSPCPLSSHTVQGHFFGPFIVNTVVSLPTHLPYRPLSTSSVRRPSVSFLNEKDDDSALFPFCSVVNVLFLSDLRRYVPCCVGTSLRDTIHDPYVTLRYFGVTVTPLCLLCEQFPAERPLSTCRVRERESLARKSFSTTVVGEPVPLTAVRLLNVLPFFTLVRIPSSCLKPCLNILRSCLVHESCVTSNKSDKAPKLTFPSFYKVGSHLFVRILSPFSSSLNLLSQRLLPIKGPS